MKLLRSTTILAAVIAGASIVLMAYAAYSIFSIYDWVDTPAGRDQTVAGCMWISLLCHLLLLAWTVFVVSRNRRHASLGLDPSVSSATGVYPERSRGAANAFGCRQQAALCLFPTLSQGSRE